MGKKQKEQGEVAPTSVNGVPNRDVMQRMNFLWQASVYLGRAGKRIMPMGNERSGETDGDSAEMTKEEEEGKEGEVDVKMEVGEGEEIVSEEKGKQKRNRRRNRRNKAQSGDTATMRDLARIYVRTMRAVGQKTTVKMDPGVKRTLCRRCSIVLVPGVSVRIRVRPSKDHGHWMVYTCLECGTSRRIPAPHTETVNSGDGGGVEAEDDTSSTKDAEGNGVTKMQHEECEKSVGPGLGKGKKKKRRKDGGARAPPLFARRSAGHVVFRGREVVDMEGVYCV